MDRNITISVIVISIILIVLYFIYERIPWTPVVPSKYFFYHNFESPRNNTQFYMNSDIETLKNICNNSDNCKGFNSMGYIKSDILPQNEWINLDNKNTGLYVKS